MNEANGAGRTALAVALLLLLAAACREPRETRAPASPGGPLAELTEQERARFLLGRALFERVVTVDEGLGPLFNASRCSDCHDQPEAGGGGTAIPVRKATRFEHGRCDLLEAVGGDNLQQRVTAPLAALGMGAEAVPERADTSVSVTSPPLFGLGLVEAIPEAALEALADPGDADGDGISGRLPRLPDGRAARFGRKGDAATLGDFVDTALRFELGLTTPDHPFEETRNGESLPRGVDPAPEPEIDARGVSLLTDYVRFLAPPAREPAPTRSAADDIAEGEELFGRMGCAACHVPELTTGRLESRALSLRSVELYSDLLLHDLGPPGVDVCGRDAMPGEYRTTPLWGLRHRTTLMHDGGAPDLETAIEMHAGEARDAREAFARLPPASQAKLIRFLRSL